METQKPKILVVDDDSGSAKLTGYFLEKLGYDSRVVSSAKVAVTALEEESFGAVISDNIMPGITGAELFDIISEKYPELKRRFLFFTGADVKDPRGCPTLLKPADYEKFATAVKNLIKFGEDSDT